MCEEDRWAHAQQAVEGIAEVAAQYDSDGIDLHFINSTQVGTRLTVRLISLFTFVSQSERF